MRTRSSWRDLPLEFGKWETTYKRYRLWQNTGLWPRLLALLGDGSVKPLTEVTL
jgi:transposase